MRRKIDTTKECPVCGKPPINEHAPFCGRGCKDRDLLRWLDEGYRIPGPAASRQSLGGVDSDPDEG